MEYYDSKKVVEITGLGKSAAYQLIKDLNIRFKREYPGVIIIRAKIPKWYFEKKLLNKEPELNKNA